MNDPHLFGASLSAGFGSARATRPRKVSQTAGMGAHKSTVGSARTILFSKAVHAI